MKVGQKKPTKTDVGDHLPHHLFVDHVNSREPRFCKIGFVTHLLFNFVIKSSTNASAILLGAARRLSQHSIVRVCSNSLNLRTSVMSLVLLQQLLSAAPLQLLSLLLSSSLQLLSLRLVVTLPAKGGQIF
jgi:hypothetical protein